MIKQIKYFQAVVQHMSFTEASEECHISQSAISQQIQALERELGFKLLERKNRKFSLTKAGEYFYQKSLILIKEYEQMCQEAKEIAIDSKATLSIGYLRGYSGHEFQLALAEFSQKYPNVTLKIEYGNHEELYEMMRDETVDIILNDQRRAFSDEYENRILMEGKEYIEVSLHHPLAKYEFVNVSDLKDYACILVTSKQQRVNEQSYYQNVIGFQGEFMYAESVDEARLKAIGGQGFMVVEGIQDAGEGRALKRIPLCRNDKQITRNYCAFWKKDNSGYYIEEFADILKSKYE